MRITEGRHDVDSDLLCEECGYFPCQCDEQDALALMSDRKQEANERQMED